MQDSVIEQFKEEKNDDGVENEVLKKKVAQLSTQVVELEKREIDRIENDSLASSKWLFNIRINSWSKILRLKLAAFLYHLEPYLCGTLADVKVSLHAALSNVVAQLQSLIYTLLKIRPTSNEQ